MKKSQTATEYLIILALIMVIAIIVVSALGYMPSFGGRSGDQANMAKLQLLDVGVQSYSVTPNGTTVQLRNNKEFMIRIVNVSINTISCEPIPTNAIPTILDIGSSRTIFCPNINESVIGSRYEYPLEIVWERVDPNARYVLFVDSAMVGVVGESTRGPPSSGGGEEGGEETPPVAFSCNQTTSSPLAYFYNGSGTPESPYGICNVTMLQEMRQNLSAHYVLVDNINASDTVNWNEGAGFEPVGTELNPFTGSLDGSLLNISNLSIIRPSSSNLGLFSKNQGNLSNLIIDNIYLEGRSNMGGVVGIQEGGMIKRIFISGSMRVNSNVGGIFGCLVGSFVNGIIAEVQSSCYLQGTSNSGSAGGIAGSQDGGTISNSYSFSNLYSGGGIGGIVGKQNGGVILDSFSASNVSTGYNNAGGIVGTQNGGNITRSWSIGGVSGIYGVGGLVGSQSSNPNPPLPVIFNSYWDVVLTNQNNCYYGGSDGCISTNNQESLYFGSNGIPFQNLSWDINIWTPVDGGYPILAWQD